MINEHEARALARHWAKEYEDLDVAYAAFEWWSGGDTRRHVRCLTGIQALHEAGLLSEEECRRILGDAHAANADFWASFEAAGRVVGFVALGVD